MCVFALESGYRYRLYARAISRTRRKYGCSIVCRFGSKLKSSPVVVRLRVRMCLCDDRELAYYSTKSVPCQRLDTADAVQVRAGGRFR